MIILLCPVFAYMDKISITTEDRSLQSYISLLYLGVALLGDMLNVY